MMYEELNKLIIVEGITDKQQLEKVLTEDVTIVCTHGTLGVEESDELIEEYELDYRDVYILTDQDDPGKKLRRQLTQELPHAMHLYVDREYREVAATPTEVLARLLDQYHFDVHPVYLQF